MQSYHILVLKNHEQGETREQIKQEINSDMLQKDVLVPHSQGCQVLWGVEDPDQEYQTDASQQAKTDPDFFSFSKIFQGGHNVHPILTAGVYQI